MKKTSKYILITLAVLVVLGGAIAALYFTDPSRAPEAQESSASTDTTSVSLFTKEKAEVSKVSVKNKQGEYTLVQTATTETAESAQGEEAPAPTTTYAYQFAGYEKYPVVVSEIEAMLRNVCAPSANKDLGEVSNLADYGLTGENASAVTVEFTDGSKESFVVGIEGGETAGRYILYNGRVYIGYMSAPVVGGMYDYLQGISVAESGPVAEDGSAQPALFYNLTLTGTNYPEQVDLSFVDTAGEYRMTAPLTSSANLSNMETLTAALSKVTSTEVVLANATAADLEAHGLNTPYATVRYQMNDTTYTFSVSEQKVGGQRYMLANGDNTIIYTIAAADVAAWAESNVTKLRSVYVYLPMIMNVDEFTVEAKGKTTVVDLSRTKNEEKSTEAQTIYDYTAKLDGRDIAYDTVPKFYGSMISIAVLNNEKLAHEETPELTFTFRYYEGGQDVVTYYRASEDRLVAMLNGAYTATIRGTSVETFLTTLETFSTQE